MHPTEHPLVSIVIPAFNQAGYLVEAIESVLAQDYPQIELIVLDDGSSDETPSVIARFARRLRHERHDNMGQAQTLNKGWGMSRGTILSYLAADDYLLPGAVRRSVENLLDHPAAVLSYCDYQLVDPRSRFIRNVTTPEYSYHGMVVRVICAPGPGVFMRRAAWERAGNWNAALRQIPDFEYWLRLGLEGDFKRIPETLAAYRVHNQSQSFAPVGIERAEETLNVIAAHLCSPRVPPAILGAKNEALSSARIVTARFHLRSGRYCIAVQHLLAAFRLYPRNCLRLRTWRLVVNGLFNRLGHRVFWILRPKIAAETTSHG
jgi:glycosyltransferase involved in cell wall biosynthesis